MKIFLCINIGASVHTAVAGVCVFMQISILSREKPLLAAHLISLLKWMTWSAVRHIILILAPGWDCQCSRYRETTWPISTEAHKVHFMILLQSVWFASMGQPIIFHKFQKEQHLLGSSQNKDCWGIWYLFHVYIKRSQAVIDLLSLHSSCLHWVMGLEASCSKQSCVNL